MSIGVKTIKCQKSKGQQDKKTNNSRQSTIKNTTDWASSTQTIKNRVWTEVPRKGQSFLNLGRQYIVGICLLSHFCKFHKRSPFKHYNIFVTNDCGYVPLVVSTSRSFPHAWRITGFVTRLTRRVRLEEQKLLTIPEHLN